MNEVKCLICGGGDFLKIHHGVRDNDSIDVLKCRRCGMVRLSDFIHENDDYYRNSEMRASNKINEFAITERQKNDLRRVSLLADQICGKSVLDVGCGFGGFLKLARCYADNVAGVELDDILRKDLKKENIDVRKSIQEYADYKFDIITMFHVIEHIIDPRELLYGIYSHLKEGGMFVVETPNADDALLTMFDCDAFKSFTYWSAHVQLYTSETLGTIISKEGFKIILNKQIQRYPLSNHLYWMSCGKPGGHKKWMDFDTYAIQSEYEQVLGKLGKCDTLFLIARKEG